MTDWVYRVAFTAYLGGGSTTYHYATRSYSTTAAHPSVPSAFIDGLLTQPLLLQRDLYGEGRTHGEQSEIPHGEVVLNNSGGAFDSLTLYAFDTQIIEVWRVDPATAETADDRLIFRGVMEDVTIDFKELRILARDMTYVYDRPLQPTKYAGSNSLPNGLEGTANDLKGRPKPICLGTAFNIEPPMVNTSRLIFQIHDAAFTAGFTLTVYDQRITLNAGILRTLADFNAGATSATVSSINTATDVITTTAVHGFSTADPVHMASTTTLPGGVLDTQYYYARAVTTTTLTLHPTATDATNNTNIVDITSAGSGTITVAKNRTPYGRYDWCSDAAGSYIRTGLKPTLLTCDVVNAVGATSWDVVFQALMSRAASNNADINALGLTFADRVSSFSGAVTVGVFWTEETSIYEAMRDVLRAVGGSMHVLHSSLVSTNFIFLLRFNPADPDQPLLLTDENIHVGTLNRKVPQDAERGIPTWRVNVSYKRNYRVMGGADVSAISASDLAFVQQEWRFAKSEDSTVLAAYRGAPEINAVTPLTVESEAVAFGTYLRSVRPMQYQMFSLEIPLEVFAEHQGIVNVYGVVPGQHLVTLTNDRFGLSTGHDFVATGYTVDYKAGTADLILWG